MEKLLKTLFEYQKYVENPHLNEVIKTTLSSSTESAVELTDESLFSVAGGANNQYEQQKNIDDQDIVKKRYK